MLIDEDLNWKDQIDHVYSKIIKFSSIFYKINQRIPQPVKRMIYFAFIHSHILYGIEIYGNTHQNYLNKLVTLNNKLLRILQTKPFMSHTADLYKSYNTLQIPLLFRFQLLSLVHKSYPHSNKLPDSFTNYFIKNF